jgi:hypothetical protein
MVGLTAHWWPITEHTWVAAIVLQNGSVRYLAMRGRLEKFIILILWAWVGTLLTKRRRKLTWLVTWLESFL